MLEDRGVPIEEYLTHVKLDLVSEIDYGKWIKFEESYPPLKDKPYEGVLIEILHNGDPYFNCIFHNGKSVYLRRYDWHMDLFIYRDPEYTSDYWRFIPKPLGNEGYDCG